MAVALKLYRGTTYNFTYNHKDTAGAQVPLTGCTVYFTVKKAKSDSSADDATAVIKKTVTEHTDAAHGITGFKLNDADTQIDPGKYFFDVVVEAANGEAEPPSLLGTVTVLAKQTNRNVGNES